MDEFLVYNYKHRVIAIARYIRRVGTTRYLLSETVRNPASCLSEERRQGQINKEK